MPEALKQHGTWTFMDRLIQTDAAGAASLRLTFDLVHVWIHECSTHGTLWDAEPTANVSLARTRMLQRSLDASKMGRFWTSTYYAIDS
jgi:hypothetical protein